MADKKITALTALGTADVDPAADLLHIIDYSASPVNKKITVANLFDQVNTNTSIYGASKTLEVGFAAATNAHLTVATGANATTDGGVTVNDDGVAYVDFTVKSLGSDGAIKVDAGTDDVTINSDSIAALDFTVNGDNGVNIYSDGGLDCVGIGTGTVDGNYTCQIAADATTGGALQLQGHLSINSEETIACNTSASAVSASATTAVTNLTTATGQTTAHAVNLPTSGLQNGQIKIIVHTIRTGSGDDITLQTTNRLQTTAVLFQHVGDTWVGMWDASLTKWITLAVYGVGGA